MRIIQSASVFADELDVEGGSVDPECHTQCESYIYMSLTNTVQLLLTSVLYRIVFVLSHLTQAFCSELVAVEDAVC